MSNHCSSGANARGAHQSSFSPGEALSPPCGFETSLKKLQQSLPVIPFILSKLTLNWKKKKVLFFSDELSDLH